MKISCKSAYDKLSEMRCLSCRGRFNHTLEICTLLLMHYGNTRNFIINQAEVGIKGEKAQFDTGDVMCKEYKDNCGIPEDPYYISLSKPYA